MSDWNSNQYMKFGAERTQPSIDLVNRIADINPNRILDIGCGPGNSTDRLAKQFPNADILGVDFSEDMLRKAGVKNMEELEIKFPEFNKTTNMTASWIPMIK